MGTTKTFLTPTEAALLTSADPTEPDGIAPVEGITFALRGVKIQLGLIETDGASPGDAPDLTIYGLFKDSTHPLGRWWHLADIAAVDLSLCPRFIAIPEVVGYEKLYVKSSDSVGKEMKYFFVTEPNVHF